VAGVGDSGCGCDFIHDISAACGYPPLDRPERALHGWPVVKHWRCGSLNALNIYIRAARSLIAGQM
jgi:hypothetical protein